VPFSDIVGHAPLIALLRQAVSKNRVPQSLLFAGPEGVGKGAVAMALAQAVNCPRQQNGDACGTCPTCQRIARGQHSDVTVLDRGDEASIKIPALRDRVLESVNYRPFEAARRVFIIDPADAMTVQAQDALLKTLEEPPSAAIIVLVSAYADTLQPTIQSRCRRLRFGLLVEADVARILKAQGIDAGSATRMAAHAGGTVSRALTGQDEFDEDRSAALGLLAAARGSGILARLKAATALTRHDSDRRDREALSDRLAILLSLLRDLTAIGASNTLPLAHADLAGDLGGLVSAFNSERVMSAFDTVEAADDALGRNASPKLVADWIAVTI
jgi:DNA polymerase III subunit delta'